MWNIKIGKSRSEIGSLKFEQKVQNSQQEDLKIRLNDQKLVARRLKGLKNY